MAFEDAIGLPGKIPNFVPWIDSLTKGHVGDDKDITTRTEMFQVSLFKKKVFSVSDNSVRLNKTKW